MDVNAFLEELRQDPTYAGQIIHIHVEAARPATYASPRVPMPPAINTLLDELGMQRLYSHQAEALDAVCAAQDTVIATGTASGKSLSGRTAQIELWVLVWTTPLLPTRIEPDLGFQLPFQTSDRPAIRSSFFKMPFSSSTLSGALYQWMRAGGRLPRAGDSIDLDVEAEGLHLFEPGEYGRAIYGHGPQ